MSDEIGVYMIGAVLFAVQIAGTLALYYLTTTDRRREWIDWQITLARKWWRGECKWCRQPRLSSTPAEARRSNLHTRVALDMGLCYNCAKEFNYARSYGMQWTGRPVVRFRPTKSWYPGIEPGDLVEWDVDKDTFTKVQPEEPR